MRCQQNLVKGFEFVAASSNARVLCMHHQHGTRPNAICKGVPSGPLSAAPSVVLASLAAGAVVAAECALLAPATGAAIEEKGAEPPFFSISTCMCM